MLVAKDPKIRSRLLELQKRGITKIGYNNGTIFDVKEEDAVFKTREEFNERLAKLHGILKDVELVKSKSVSKPMGK